MPQKSHRKNKLIPAVEEENVYEDTWSDVDENTKYDSASMDTSGAVIDPAAVIVARTTEKKRSKAIIEADDVPSVSGPTWETLVQLERAAVLDVEQGLYDSPAPVPVPVVRPGPPKKGPVHLLLGNKPRTNFSLSNSSSSIINSNSRLSPTDRALPIAGGVINVPSKFTSSVYAVRRASIEVQITGGDGFMCDNLLCARVGT
jgi:hypothetical protein